MDHVEGPMEPEEQMTVLPVAEFERLVKSEERVRDLGEVFTPAATVAAMLDLLPADVWRPHPSSTFLEPACGDGNFLVAILDRKLEAVSVGLGQLSLPAGVGTPAFEFHALEALASIYAIDISSENVLGGTPGHEVGARDRLLRVFGDWWVHVVGSKLASRSRVLRSAQWIVDRNILVGNMLETNADGSPSGRDELPLVEYSWDPTDGRVGVAVTTFGQVMSEQLAESTGVMSLFTDDTPTEVWEGPAADLHKAPVIAPSANVAVVRNGRGRP